MHEHPPKVPLVSKGDVLRFMAQRMKLGQHQALTAMAAKYGPVFQAKLRGRTFFIVSEPRWLRHILITQQKNYSKAAMSARLGAVLGKGLFTSDGPFWKRQRILVQPAYAPKQVEIYAEAVLRHAEALVARLEQHAASGAKFDVYAEVVHFTLDVVMETILGSQSRQIHQRVHRAISIIFETMEAASISDRLQDLFPPLRYLPFWKGLISRKQREGRVAGSSSEPNLRTYDEALAAFDAVLYEIVAERQEQVAREQSGQARDVLSLLIKARDEAREGMSDKQLRDELAIAFVAGHETSALALAWTFVLLAQNPAVAARLRAELDSVLQGAAPTYAHLEQLPYTKAVIQETLRLYPPIWRLARTAEADDEIDGTPIAKGTLMVIVPYITQRLAQYWKEPESFRPERFLGPEASADRELLSYLPFGAGPRVCVGQGFAMSEMVLALASVGQRFTFTLDPATDLAMDAKLSLRPKYPLWMRVRLGAENGHGKTVT